MDAFLYQDELVKSNRILYTPSVFAKANLIHLQEAGESQSIRPHTCKRESHSSYLFFIVVSGKGSLQHGDENFNLSSGNCVFLNCHKMYAHRSSEDLWKLKWVHFYGPNMNGIYEKYLQRGGRVWFDTIDSKKYEILLQEIYEIATSDDYVRDMRIFEKLATLLTFLMEESWRSGIIKKKTRYIKSDLQSIKVYLDENFQKKIILDELSEQFFINKFYLTKIFKEEYGISIHNYIAQVRITHAKLLLRFTDDSIEKVGQQCGMDDGNYFARVFRKIEGVSPRQFREYWTK